MSPKGMIYTSGTMSPGDDIPSGDDIAIVASLFARILSVQPFQEIHQRVPKLVTLRGVKDIGAML
jgi:hypothetical protein